MPRTKANSQLSPAPELPPLNEPAEYLSGLSIDNLIFGLDHGQLDIMLVKHDIGPGKGGWALPGGFIGRQENLRDAAARLLQNLTGVRDLYLEQLKAFGRIDRFPEERVVTIAYYALVSAEDYPLVAGTNAEEAKWFNVNELPPLIYDHSDIVQYGVQFLRHQVCHKPIGFNLLPEKFTLLQLQELYESILDTKLDKPNFRRKMMKMNLLAPCNEKQTGVPHRAANLYRFDSKAYERLTQKGFSFEF
ncbi:NUDIX domain-containing protein [Marinimicrobium sp. ABcell2]|uniref:NUDIX hydrolase n=1 Tax=Marinimicrobium sp. ABcell2 TaxID=3069751 RepID=UPI00359C7456